MTYDLKSVRAPRLCGSLLAAVVRLVENPVTRALVLPQLLARAGVPTLRTWSPAPTAPPLPVSEHAEPTERAPLCERHASPAPVGAADAAPVATPFESVADFARAYREGSSTPARVVERALAAIESSDARAPALRAVVACRPREVREDAQASTRRYATGHALGPLDGVPVVVKEEFDVRGYATTGGTRFLTTPATTDAAVVQKFREAGAIVLGKANMHEIGIDATGFNAHHGTPRNPYDPDCYTGGSSSGPAAAVASGLCPLAIGADGGGSIRIPAALCGIVGLKPTFGRVSTVGALPLCRTVAHVGPMGATAEDVALGYAVMTGAALEHDDDAEPSVVTSETPQAGRGNQGDKSVEELRIGIYEPWFADATPDVVQVCRRLVTELEKRGATVVPIELPNLELCRVAHGVTILSEMTATVAPWMADHGRDFGWPVRLTLALARSLKTSDYLLAQQVRVVFAAHVERAFRAADVIVTPATGLTAPRIRPEVMPRGESDLQMTSALMRHAFPFNLTGHPAISFPAGYDAGGLPVGMQAVGPAGSEGLLLRLARATAKIVPRRRPLVHYSLLT